MNRIAGSILILHGRTPKIVIQPFRVQLYCIIATRRVVVWSVNCNARRRRKLYSEESFQGWWDPNPAMPVEKS